MNTPRKRTAPRPTAFIARDLAAIPITEGLLTELGFSFDPRREGSVWAYHGGTVFPVLLANDTLTLDDRIVAPAFSERGYCTLLDLLQAAHCAGWKEGREHAQNDIRRAIGLED